jgi:two-component system sensor histidine kinase VicK
MAAAPHKISPKIKENLELAQKNIDSVKGIVSDFLEVSNIDTNKVKLEMTELDFCSVVSEVVETLSPLADERDIELESSVPDSELVVNADCDKMTQVLTSLISNSINSVAANGHISVRVKDAGNEIAVEIEDDGPSIESGEISKIFNRFEQIRKQLCAGKKELALDLPIARELVEMHGGWIWAESRDGQGNSFCFTLPKQNADEAIASAAVKETGQGN